MLYNLVGIFFLLVSRPFSFSLFLNVLYFCGFALEVLF